MIKSKKMNDYKQKFHELSMLIGEELFDNIIFQKPGGYLEGISNEEFTAIRCRISADAYLRYVIRTIVYGSGENNEISLQELETLLQSGSEEIAERNSLPKDIGDVALKIAKETVLNEALDNSLPVLVRRKQYNIQKTKEKIFVTEK